MNVFNLLSNNMDKKRWEESEINFLKDNYKERGFDFCVRSLPNRTLESIDRKISRLKLKKRSKVWTEDEVNFLKQFYAIKGSLFCVEKLNDRTIESVRLKAGKLGIDRDVVSRYNQIIAPDGYKHCPSCSQILPLGFYYRKNKKNEYDEEKTYRICRSCAMEKSKRNYRTHKSSSVERYRKNPIKKILSNLKTRSKSGGYPFDLDEDDIIIPDFCPVLGIPIIPNSNSDNSPSVDKFISTLGYVKGNVFVISKRANRIKCDANIEEIEKLLNWMKSK